MSHFDLWQNKTLRMLGLTIFLGLLATSSLFFLSHRFKNYLEDKASGILGSDRRISAPKPISPIFKEEAEALGLKTAHALQFFSMVVYNTHFSLASVKAVDAAYPLKGKLRTSEALYGAEKDMSGIPEPGTVWLEPRLFITLDLSLGDIVTIGKANFKVTAILSFDTDKVGEGRFLAPLVLMNEQDLPKTGLILPGSRQTYNLMVAGREENLELYDKWVDNNITGEMRYTNIQNTRGGGTKRVLDQAQDFLAVCLSINIFLCGSSIIIILRNFIQTNFETVALLRAMGAAKVWIFKSLLKTLLLISLSGGLLGIVAGGAADQGIYQFFKESLFQWPHTLTFGLPVALSLGAILLLIGGFVVPPILRLQKISPMEVLKRSRFQFEQSSESQILITILMAGLFIFLYLRDLISTLQNLAWAVIVVVVSYYFILFMVYLLNLACSSSNLSLGISTHRIRLRVIFENIRENALQIAVLTLSFSAIIVLYLVRNDLLVSWKNQFPSHTPNYFAINLPPEELNHFNSFIKKHNILASQLYPIVRGRVVSINGQSVQYGMDVLSDKKEPARLLNLSYTLELQADNQVTAGRWLTKEDEGKPHISIEKEFAERQNIHVGDKVGFQIAEKEISAEVVGIRSVEWDSFNPNFYVIFPPGVLEDFPKSYMTSFYLPPAQIAILKDLIRQFPAVSIIDIVAILSLLDSILRASNFALDFFFGLTLCFGVLLLFVTLISSYQDRLKTFFLLKVMGTTQRQLTHLLYSEFLIIGVLSGGAAVLLSNFVCYWLSHSLFKMDYHPNLVFSVMAFLFSFGVVVISGWLGTRRLLTGTALKVLQPATIF